MIKSGTVLYWESTSGYTKERCKFIEANILGDSKAVWTDLYGKTWDRPDKFFLDGKRLSEKDFDFPKFVGRVIKD
jgi:hypothetical protein